MGNTVLMLCWYLMLSGEFCCPIEDGSISRLIHQVLFLYHSCSIKIPNALARQSRKNYLYACMPVWIFKENLCEEEKILIIDLFCISEFLIISIVLRITLIKAHYYWAFLTSFWWNVHGRSGQRLRLMGS